MDRNTNVLEDYHALYRLLHGHGPDGAEAEERFYNACFGLFRTRARRLINALGGLPAPDIDAAAAEVKAAASQAARLVPQALRNPLIQSALADPLDGTLAEMLTHLARSNF